MVINILSIPPISDKAEHVFSGAYYTISYNRARLRADTIEMIECLGSWNKNNLIRMVYILPEGDR